MELVRLDESAGRFPTVSLQDPTKVSKVVHGDSYDLALATGGDEYRATASLSLRGSGRQRNLSSFVGNLAKIEAQTHREESLDGSGSWTRYLIDVYNYETGKWISWSRNTRYDGEGCGDETDRCLNRLVSDVASKVDVDDQDATLQFVRRGLTRIARRDLPGSDLLRWHL